MFEPFPLLCLTSAPTLRSGPGFLSPVALPQIHALLGEYLLEFPELEPAAEWKHKVTPGDIDWEAVIK